MTEPVNLDARVTQMRYALLSLAAAHCRATGANDIDIPNNYLPAGSTEMIRDFVRNCVTHMRVRLSPEDRAFVDDRIRTYSDDSHPTLRYMAQVEFCCAISEDALSSELFAQVVAYFEQASRGKTVEFIPKATRTLQHNPCFTVTSGKKVVGIRALPLLEPDARVPSSFELREERIMSFDVGRTNFPKADVTYTRDELMNWVLLATRSLRKGCLLLHIDHRPKREASPELDLGAGSIFLASYKYKVGENWCTARLIEIPPDTTYVSDVFIDGQKLSLLCKFTDNELQVLHVGVDLGVPFEP